MGITKSIHIKIHVFMSAESKTIDFNEIHSMIISVINMDSHAQLDVQYECVAILCNLLQNSWGKLRKLKLSDFIIGHSLWPSIEKLQLDWFHLTRPSFVYNFRTNYGFKRLHLSLEKHFCEGDKFHIPLDVEELSICLFDFPETPFKFFIDECGKLRKV